MARLLFFVLAGAFCVAAACFPLRSPSDSTLADVTFGIGCEDPGTGIWPDRQFDFFPTGAGYYIMFPAAVAQHTVRQHHVTEGNLVCQIEQKLNSNPSDGSVPTMNAWKSRDRKQVIWPVAGIVIGALAGTNPFYQPRIPLEVGI